MSEVVEFFLCKREGLVWIYFLKYLIICKGELSFIKKFRVVLFSYIKQQMVGVIIYLRWGSIMNWIGRLEISSNIKVSYIFFWTEGSSKPMYPKKTIVSLRRSLTLLLASSSSYYLLQYLIILWSLMRKLLNNDSLSMSLKIFLNKTYET